MRSHPGFRFSFALASSLLCIDGAWAETAPPAPVKAPQLLQEVEGGWPTDRTITVSGRDFFQAFAALWQEQPLYERYPIVIRELPSARRGTLVSIEYGQVRVFQSVLPASRPKIPALAREAVTICYQNVIDAEVRQLLFRDADLAPDEI